jgi:GAF domain-containing protein
MPAANTHVVEEEKDKPVFDEQALARLLEAAYVLQEHNRELRQREVNLEIQRDQLGAQERAISATPGNSAHSQAPEEPANADYTQTLAQIVETQRQIQARNLQLQAAMDFVSERVTEIAKAGGAAVGILSGKTVTYRSISGGMTLTRGAEVAMEKALCVASLRTGQVIRCTDINAEFLLDVEECQRRGIQSMIAVPVYHDGGIAGGLEVYYTKAQAFTEQEVHTCQLMAGLVTEALVREEEMAAQRSLAEQRAAMREAVEKLKPAVAALADRAANRTGQTAKPGEKIFECAKCGHRLVGEEQFCGNCGTPRSGDYGPPSLQSKVASLWQMQQATKKTPASDAVSTEPVSPELTLSEKVANDALADSSSVTAETSPEKLAGSPPSIDFATSATPAVPDEMNQSRVPFSIPEHEVNPELAAIEAPFKSFSEIAPPSQGEEDHARSAPEEETALAVPEQPWTSAAAARDYLEELAGAKRPSGFARFWNERRGDIYLAVAVIVVAVVIRWGIWSNHSVSATGNSTTATAQHKPDPTADLSWFDRTLIGLGLADPPPTPESKGNPETQVWVDLHTALYYCPGADLYGKTPKGKYTSQRDAQLDSFGPATGRPCD